MSAVRKPNYECDELHDRIGSPTQLAIFVADQYRARSFFGRHPVFTYLLSPIPLLVVVCVGVCLAIVATGYAIYGVCCILERFTGIPLSAASPVDHPWVSAICLPVICWLITVIPPLSTAWLVCRVAARNALEWRWPVIGCSLLAVATAVLSTSYRLPTMPNDGIVTIGFNAGSSASWFFLTFIPKFLLALGIGLAIAWREQCRHVQISDNDATISTLPAA